MAERLPPLTAIRYFECAARFLSFTKAAHELNVTHSAISHQIRALEESLGVPLFRRLNRSLVLTEAGQIFLKPVREAFDKLNEATRLVRVRDGAGPLTVTTMPSFAAKWLVPRLRRFQERHPDIDVRISATEQLVDFTRDDVDVALRYGRGVWGGLTVEKLLSESLYPVCSPRLLDGALPLKRPADLIHHNLLYDYDWRTDMWDRWLDSAGLKGLKVRRSLSFNYSNLMIQAAIDGLGVALSQDALVSDDLSAGRLVRPFDASLPTEFAYYLVYPPAGARRPKVVAFRTWLFEEAAASSAVSSAHKPVSPTNVTPLRAKRPDAESRKTQRRA
jgi:LysR family transcriptional regulator, glycine cleavage system transcriptional activator